MSQMIKRRDLVVAAVAAGLTRTCDLSRDQLEVDKPADSTLMRSS
jgi:hypothetical protein